MSEKIEPAISAARWKSLSDAYAGDRIVDRIVANANEGRQTAVRDIAMAAVIALANAALPDSDPRKITRAWVRELRRIADTADEADRMGEKEGALVEAWLVRQIADALESYLPPA